MAEKWGMPPPEKIPEAWSAIVDGRVKMGAGQAEVTSSDGSKSYTVTWNENRYSSNDNASYWQGYLGYPLIAVLMLQGKIPFDEKTAQVFRGVVWKKLNKEYRNDFAGALDSVLHKLDNRQDVLAAMDLVYRELKKADLARTRGRHPPGVNK